MSAAGLALALAVLAGDPAAVAPAAPALPPAHPAGVQARASRREVKLGERFDYAIEIRHGASEAYALPAAPALAPFQADGGSCRRGPDPAGARTVCTLRLALFALGPHEIPALTLPVETPAGPAALEVTGPAVTGVGLIDPAAPAGSLQLRDIAPPVPLLVRTWRYVLLAAGALLAVALAVLGWRLWRRRAGAAGEPAAPMPADVRLERRLDALEAERLVAQGRAAEHLARASELVREYLGALAGLNALDLTTGELLAALEAGGDPRLDLPALAALLGRADLVKFARGGAAAEDCAAAGAYARALLARTRAAFAVADASGWNKPPPPTPDSVRPERSDGAPAPARRRGAPTSTLPRR